MLDSEAYFFTPGVEGMRKGDDLKDHPEKILAKGENGFAYLMGTGGQPLNNPAGNAPLIMTPIATRAQVPKFDPGPYDGTCVFGAADGSARRAAIDEYGAALTKRGRPFFEPGPDSLFGDQIPVFTYPLGL